MVVKIVNIEDMTKVIYLREQSRPAKHVSFNPDGDIVTVSCSDGQILVYSIRKENPELIGTVDGVIKTLETDAETSARAMWHPDGRAFAAPTTLNGAYNTKRFELHWKRWANR